MTGGGGRRAEVRFGEQADFAIGVEEELILAEGNGADRQRAAHARGGMPALLDLLVAGAEEPYG